ncbi:MAG: AAA family ATPase [Candidatus Omnitrophica bacterium]|nr:AAA family ATPase [Candidatus Omnitrophota bacterium]
MKIISIANQKGGCGKTTSSINLAATLGLNGKRTLLIDLDPQAHATLGLNIDDQNSLYNVISKLTPRKLKIENIIKKVDANFDIVPSNILVGTLEQELADEIGRELKLIEVINTIKDQYDYVLIDCPPSLGFLTVNAIRASDEVMIPVETSRFSMQGVDHLMDIINLIRDRLNHPVTCRVLITMFDSRLRHSFAMLAKMKEKFEGILISTIIHINVKLKESAVMGESVIKYDKYCRGSKDYFSLAKELILFERGERVEIAESVPQESVAAPSGLSQRMRELVKQETQDILSTTFALEAPEAQSVYVTGSFNDWSLDESCRMNNENGSWKINLALKPGIYKYQFIIDGKWQEDPQNTMKERNSFGDINSLIEVK